MSSSPSSSTSNSINVDVLLPENNASDHDGDRRRDSGASDAECQGSLEVILETESSGRRKSSLPPEEAERLVRTMTDRRVDTACRVHALLAQERKMEKASALHRVKDMVEDRKSDKEGGEHDKHLRSRLLSKKELSDMAWGVRELAKKLGSVRLRVKVRTVFVLVKAYDESLIRLSRELTAWLLSEERDAQYTVYVEDTLRDNGKFDAKGLVAEDATYGHRLKYWTNELCRKRPQTFDFVISLGGDGTVLYASWLFQRVVPPILSFGLGSLGFLTKFDFEDYRDVLTKAFRDGVTVSLRLRFEGTVMRSQRKGGEGRDLVEELIGEEKDDERTHKADGTHEILNDIVVDRGPNATMSAIEVFGDDNHFTTVQADGVCVATPTGSTAYNLAAGGSLCHPDNPVILVTAICAHTLSFRPIILPDTVVLRVGVPYDARTSSWASFDGRERVELCPGDYVTISASRYPFANVMPPGSRSEDWIHSISRTLHWNNRARQKAFDKWERE